MIRLGPSNLAPCLGTDLVGLELNGEASTDKTVVLSVPLVTAVRAFASLESWQQLIAPPDCDGGQFGPQQSAVKAAALTHDVPPAHPPSGEMSTIAIRAAMAVMRLTTSRYLSNDQVTRLEADSLFRRPAFPD